MQADLEDVVLEFPDYYDLLGVPATASVKELDAAFWKQAPGLRNASKESKPATRQFFTLLEGYKLLSDPSQRKVYDAWRVLSPEDREEVSKEFELWRRTDRSVRDFERKETVRALESTVEMLGQIYPYTGDTSPQEARTYEESARAELGFDPPLRDLYMLISFCAYFSSQA